jgi:hypothetical protein
MALLRALRTLGLLLLPLCLTVNALDTMVRLLLKAEYVC